MRSSLADPRGTNYPPATEPNVFDGGTLRMVRGAQYAFVALAWLFAGSRNLELHVTFGWILHLWPILILAAAALARAGRTRIL
jgi:hypothetical protein